jgi:hypothetical protein
MHVARVDYEYRRNGTVNLFVAADAHQSWRKVSVTERRTAQDYAEPLRDVGEALCRTPCPPHSQAKPLPSLLSVMPRTPPQHLPQQLSVFGRLTRAAGSIPARPAG